MLTSLRARLWLSYALLIVTALGVVAVFLLAYIIRSPLLYRQTIDRLKAVEAVVLAREQTTGERPPVNLPAALQRADETFDVRLTLFSQDGQILFDTRQNQAALRLPPQPPRLLPIVRDTQRQPWLYTARRLPDGEWLMISTPRPRLQLASILRDELFSPVIQAGAISLLLSLFLAFWISGWVANPLQRLLAAVRAVPSEQVHNIPDRGPREVKDLTRAFNAMANRVQISQKSQRDFVANVSHELKTPLTSIQGFAQAILDGTATAPKDQKQAAQVIYNEAGRMHRMVLDLLDLARLDAGTADLKMGPVDMGALLRSTIEKFELQAREAGISLGLDAGELPILIGDGDRLAQVLTNLVDNAIKHTPTGGRVNLQAAAVNLEMEINVSDTGRGISQIDQQHIFDRFYQVDPSRSGGGSHGAGLGLAIVKEIIQAHGGRISVRSQEGRGSIFSVRLPLSQPNATTLISKRK